MRLLRISASILLLSLMAAAIYIFILYPNQPLLLSEPRLVKVANGSGFNQLCRQLQREQIISWCGPLKWYSKFNQPLRLIKAGSYLVTPGSSHKQLLVQLSEGKEHQFAITFVEGDNLSQILKKLESAEHLVHQTLDKAELATKLGSPHSNIEGLLFPDTYYYAADSDSFDLIKRAYFKMDNVLQQHWQNRAEDLPYKNRYEALIMASIIEKETGQAHERSLIASVFVNRLNKRMRLQTDPTVIYGLGDQFDGDITRAHLRQKTPYNTYRINGLPPTPIAMPGSEAIEAALNPDTTEFLYFVAKKDGTHKFSKTLKEHNLAVQKYQLSKPNGP